MREIGGLPRPEQAEQFVDYLASEGIRAAAEPEGDEWLIWIRSEDDVPRAQAALADFRKSPDEMRFRGHAGRATEAAQAEAEKYAQAQRNIQDARSLWEGNPAARAPVTTGLIVIAVGLFLLQLSWPAADGFLERWLLRSTWETLKAGDGPWQEILSGQVWRLFTPALLHVDVLHIAMNSFALWILGGRIERHRNFWLYLLLILTTAVGATVASTLHDPGLAAGLSGIVFGLFGYIWINQLLDPWTELRIEEANVFIFLGFLALGLTGLLEGLFPGIDHWGHLGGFLVGVAVAGMPFLVQRPRRQP